MPPSDPRDRLTCFWLGRKVIDQDSCTNGVPDLRRNIPFFPLKTLAILAGVLWFAQADVLRAQRIAPPVLLPETTNPAINGQINVRVQQDTGSPFASPFTVTLRSSDMSVNLTGSFNQAGQTAFTGIPAGQYLLEVTAPGYSPVREQVSVNLSGQVQNIAVAMIPEGSVDPSRIPSSGVVPPKAIKETEKGLRALQVGKLDETQTHLTRALAIAPNFADGNYLMGVLLLRRNESGKALTYLQKAVDVAPNHAPALLALGQAAYFQRDYVRATASLEQSLREQPRAPQAAIAQQLIARMRESTQSKADGSAAAENSSTADLAIHKDSADAGNPDPTALADLPAITPVTETNWIPPDIDQERLVLDSGASCQLNDVIQATGDRVRELVENVDRFTATEKVEHFSLSPLGLQISRETRKFDYMVEIRPFGAHDLDVQEYRNGSVSAQQFPGHIGTIGLPTVALVFHPDYQEKYEFVCEGRGAWRGKPAWMVHFQQRTDRKSAMLVYRVGGKSFAVGLKGRAWIDTVNSQILAIETDTMRPVPEIRLMRDHQLIEYGPVDFRNDTLHLWLPKSADWYSSLSGQRYHRRHTFSHFLLFSVDDQQKIGKPKEPVEQAPTR
jgi:tetratricopeptide (TPR) repeat protein